MASDFSCKKEFLPFEDLDLPLPTVKFVLGIDDRKGFGKIGQMEEFCNSKGGRP